MEPLNRRGNRGVKGRFSTLLAAAALSLLMPVSAAPAASDSSTPGHFRSLLELRQENVVAQHWDLSCGAAALATILTYEYGDAVSEKAVAEGLLRRTEPLKVKQRGGFSLLDLKHYAQSRGYDAIGFAELDLQQLMERAPAIVPLQATSANHFVVFRGFLKDGRVALADPAWGNRTMPLAEFEAAWVKHVAFVIERAQGDRSQNRLTLRRDDRLLPSDE